MIQIQFRIKVGKHLDIATDLLEREDTNDRERDIACEVEHLTDKNLFQEIPKY